VFGFCSLFGWRGFGYFSFDFSVCGVVGVSLGFVGFCFCLSFWFLFLVWGRY